MYDDEEEFEPDRLSEADLEVSEMTEPTLDESTGQPLYPEIEVQLTGTDGNAFAIISKVRNALRAGGVSQAERDEFMQEAMSGDYDHVLQTCMQWVEVS